MRPRWRRTFAGQRSCGWTTTRGTTCMSNRF
jgi:hypothetical protein